MKLQISFDKIAEDRVLSVISKVSNHADVIEIGPYLLYKYGVKILEKAIKKAPNSVISADIKIIDYGKALSQLMIDSGAHWVSVMAGTSKEVIHSVCGNTHSNNKKTILDLKDAPSAGQSALEAKSLGVDAILFQFPFDPKNPALFMDRWDMVKGNTDLPIYIATDITRDNIERIIEFQPDGIIISDAIINADNPAQEAKFFKDLCHKV